MNVTLFMSMTLNGYIARPDDSVDFLSDATWERYAHVLAQHDTLIVGRRTYDVIVAEGPEELKKTEHAIVVTNQLAQADGAEIARSASEALEISEKLGAKNVLVGGGAQLNGSFLNEALVDTVMVDIEPVLIQDGMPLATSLKYSLNLELVGNERNGPLLSLTYKVHK